MTGHRAVAGTRAVVLLLGDVEDEVLIRDLRTAVGTEPPLPAIVAGLMAFGVADLPSLAAAARDGDGLRVLVRGSGRACVHVAGNDAIEIAGENVTTWREEMYVDGALVELWDDASPDVRIDLVLGDIDSVAEITPQVPPRATEPSVDEKHGLDEAPDVQTPNQDDTLLPGASEPLTPSAPPTTLGPPPEDAEETIHSGFSTARSEPVPSSPPGPEPSLSKESSPVASTTISDAGLISGVPGGTRDPVTPEPTVESPGDLDRLGDHDGHTISAADLRAGLAQTATPASRSTVQAVTCVEGHANAPHAPQCRRCGGAIADRTVQDVPRPTLGRLRLSTGAVVELDRPQLIGRRPTVPEGTDLSEIPGLIAIPDPEQSLSRVHAEVKIRAWDVSVVDRGSKNGTFVEIPGHEPIKLRAGEECGIEPGTRVSLADVVEFHFEVADQ